MSHYQPYPAYKDSGVEWLGMIPEHWDVSQMKSGLISIQNGVWGDDPDGSEDDTPCARVADFDRVSLTVNEPLPTLRKITADQRLYKKVSTNDLLLEKSGGGEQTTVGAVVQYVGENDIVCSNFVAVIKCKDHVFPRWLCYLSFSLYSAGVNVRSIKQTTGIQNLDSHQYSSEQVSFPPLVEQRAIAAHLDRETARIDSLITKKTRFIELLKEKRQALITQAVTKGLDPHVKMKDSGVEWLGEVPEHWEIKSLKQVVHLDGGAGFPDEEQGIKNAPIPFFKVADLANGMLMAENYISEESAVRLRAKIFPVGTIAFAKVGAALLLNRRVSMPIAGCADNNMMLVQPIKLNSNWLLLILQCFDMAWLVNPGAVPSVNQEQVGNIKIPCPPLIEVNTIFHYVNQSTIRIDTLIQKSQNSITLLKERRSALITAAVTGQIDLREAA